MGQLVPSILFFAICWVSGGFGQNGVYLTINRPILEEGSLTMDCIVRKNELSGQEDADVLAVQMGFMEDGVPRPAVTQIAGNLTREDFKQWNNGESLKDRYSVSGSMDPYTLKWTISTPKCEEERDVYCDCSYLAPQVLNRTVYQSVTLRARPGSPELVWIQPNSVDRVITIVENDTVSARCTAPIGRQGMGNVVWRIGDFAQVITESSSYNGLDVTVSKTVPADVDNTCVYVETSTLVLRSLQSQNHNMRIACFVRNTDFQPTVPPTCEVTNNLCASAGPIEIQYPVKRVDIVPNPSTTQVYEGDTLTLTCNADANPPANYQWVKVEDENRTLTVEDILVLADLDIEADTGTYNCTATNTIQGVSSSLVQSFKVTVVRRPTTTTPTTTPTTPTTSPGPQGSKGSDDDTETIIIIVVVVVVVIIVVVVVILVYIFVCRRRKKEIEEPSEKPYNNRTNLSFVNSQPDLVADDKKFTNPSLNNSFDPKNEDGLMYADLTYDNRPRSRKPMAIGDTASEYSDVQMPQV